MIEPSILSWSITIFIFLTLLLLLVNPKDIDDD